MYVIVLDFAFQQGSKKWLKIYEKSLSYPNPLGDQDEIRVLDSTHMDYHSRIYKVWVLSGFPFGKLTSKLKKIMHYGIFCNFREAKVSN